MRSCFSILCLNSSQTPFGPQVRSYSLFLSKRAQSWVLGSLGLLIFGSDSSSSALTITIAIALPSSFYNSGGLLIISYIASNCVRQQQNEVSFLHTIEEFIRVVINLHHIHPGENHVKILESALPTFFRVLNIYF